VGAASPDFMKPRVLHMPGELFVEYQLAASNVLWPKHLAGKPMFRYSPREAKTWLGRLVRSFCKRQEFSEHVLHKLQGKE
jgi:hypothetical protein